jgi:hypothetical protein
MRRRIELTTRVIGKDKKTMVVYATLTQGSDQARSGVKVGTTYSVELFLAEEKKGYPLGGASLDVLTTETEHKYNSAEIYLSSSTIPPHVYIKDMRNTSGYAHVGSALHECVLRISFLLGCEGRVCFDAVRDTHYFHYKHGFRRDDFSAASSHYHPVSSIDYYLTLAAVLQQAGHNRIQIDLGSASFYLPRAAIEEKAKAFGIEHGPIPDTESEYERRVQHVGEMLIREAEKDSPIIPMLRALNSSFGDWHDAPQSVDIDDENESKLEMYKQAMEKYKKDNPSLLCKKTKAILNDAYELIINELPLSDERLAQIFAGTVVLALARQDKEYGPQARYGGALLYPDKSFDALYELPQQGNWKQNLSENIERVGDQVLAGELPFSAALYAKIFPRLSAITALQDLVDARLKKSYRP